MVNSLAKPLGKNVNCSPKMSNFEAKLSSYSLLSMLGHCFDGQAMVLLAKHKTSSQLVALKRIDLEKFSEVHSLENEIILTKQLKHANIVEYLLAFVNDLELCIVSPLMGFGSCKDLIYRFFGEGLPELALVRILKDVLEAVEYIHRMGYIHRAIRASHVLVSAGGRVVLTGLRYACPIILNGKWQRNIYAFPTNCTRNLNWLSPELLLQNLQGYNAKSDIYSLGMLVCELANGREPFSDMNSTLMLTEKARGCPLYLLDSTTIPVEEHYNNDCEFTSHMTKRKFNNNLHEFTALCLNSDPYDRPSALQFLNHPVFKVLQKKHVSLPELLKPAVPYTDQMALETEDFEELNTKKECSNLNELSCTWDFEVS